MELWLACALLTVAVYGLGEGLAKEPTVRLGPGRMLALYSLYSVPIYAGWFLLGNGTASLTAVGIAFGIASALCGTLGNTLWFMAMESGEASVVSGFTAAYPVVTVVAAVVGLGATLLPLQAISIALLLGATFLLGWVDDAKEKPTNRAWLPPMILAVLLWGAWGVFEKLAIASMGFAGNAGVYVLVSTPMMVALGWRESRKRGPMAAADVRAAQPTLLLWAVGGITIFLAIGLGPLAVVVPLTTVYPIVAILFRRYWMEEEMTRAQKIAVGLALVGAVLVGL